MGNSQVKEKEMNTKETRLLMENVKGDTPAEIMEQEYPVHVAGYVGDLKKLEALLQSPHGSGEPVTRKQNEMGCTPLHYIAMGGGSRATEAMKMVLKKDDSYRNDFERLVDKQDKCGKTALHYAVEVKEPELISLLLENRAQPNIRDEYGNTPLLIASSGNSDGNIECVRLLLSHDPAIKNDAVNRQQQNPLHFAARAQAPKMIRLLLSENFNPDMKDASGYTPLHYSANSSSNQNVSDCISLLLDVTENVNEKCCLKKRSPLHLAAIKCQYEAMKMLLSNVKVDVWAKDSDGRTALHLVADSWSNPHALDCAKALINCKKLQLWHDKGKYLYKNEDFRGESPIDIAIKHRSLRMAELFITAHDSPSAWLKEDMLANIYSRLPESLLPLMDECITYNPAVFHERNDAVDVDFGPIVGYTDLMDYDPPQQETFFLKKIFESPKEVQKRVLLHPLVQLFICLKWKSIRWIVWLAIAYQFLWLILYTVLIFEVYAPDCAVAAKQDSEVPKIFQSFGFSSGNDSSLTTCSFNKPLAQSIVVIMYLMTAVILLKEVFQLRHNRKYFCNLTNWGQWTLIIVFFITSAPAFEKIENISHWKLYVAAFGVFLAWILILRDVGRFPELGIYAAILRKVFLHCLKMLLFYFPLLIAFTLCLRILVPGDGQYRYFVFGIIKVFIMMTGELDFEDAFYEKGGPSLALNAIFGQIMFLLLVLMTTIVLLNLLTGLAVNDVQSLIEDAEVNRLSTELIHIYLLETFILRICKLVGSEKLQKIFFSTNVTIRNYQDFISFSPKKENLETKDFSPKLREKILVTGKPSKLE